MTTKKQESFLRTFWTNKKHDVLLFLIISFVLQFFVGSWLYTKYLAIDTAREKVERLHNEYSQIKSIRKIMNNSYAINRELIKVMQQHRLITEKQFWILYNKIEKYQNKVHTVLSKQKK